MQSSNCCEFHGLRCDPEFCGWATWFCCNDCPNRWYHDSRSSPLTKPGFDPAQEKTEVTPAAWSLAMVAS